MCIDDSVMLHHRLFIAYSLTNVSGRYLFMLPTYPWFLSASFLDCIIFGLSSTDEQCQADIVFLLVAIYKDQQTVGHIPMRLSGSLCQYICLSICSSQLYELQLNLLGKIFCSCSCYQPLGMNIG